MRPVLLSKTQNYWWFFLCSWLLGTGSGGVGGWCCSYAIGLNSFSCVNICKRQAREEGKREKKQPVLPPKYRHIWKQQPRHSPRRETRNSRGLVWMLSWLQRVWMAQFGLGRGWEGGLQTRQRWTQGLRVAGQQANTQPGSGRYCRR